MVLARSPNFDLLAMLQSGIALGLRGGIAFEVEAQTVAMDLHSGELLPPP